MLLRGSWLLHRRPESTTPRAPFATHQPPSSHHVQYLPYSQISSHSAAFTGNLYRKPSWNLYLTQILHLLTPVLRKSLALSGALSAFLKPCVHGPTLFLLFNVGFKISKRVFVIHYMQMRIPLSREKNEFCFALILILQPIIVIHISKGLSCFDNPFQIQCLNDTYPSLVTPLPHGAR